MFICDSLTNNYSSKTSQKMQYGTKRGYTHFGEKFQQNVPFLKLYSSMPLFWNSILSKSSFSVELKFMELEFFENFQVELEFHTHTHTHTYIYIYIYILKFNLPITRFSKNRVLHWNSIFRKSSFKTGAYP